jgi:hypothetical protein
MGEFGFLKMEILIVVLVTFASLCKFAKCLV